MLGPAPYSGFFSSGYISCGDVKTQDTVLLKHSVVKWQIGHGFRRRVPSPLYSVCQSKPLFKDTIEGHCGARIALNCLSDQRESAWHVSMLETDFLFRVSSAICIALFGEISTGCPSDPTKISVYVVHAYLELNWHWR